MTFHFLDYPEDGEPLVVALFYGNLPGIFSLRARCPLKLVNVRFVLRVTATAKFKKSIGKARDKWHAPFVVSASPSIFQNRYPETG